jgi:hypothetical protein
VKRRDSNHNAVREEDGGIAMAGFESIAAPQSVGLLRVKSLFISLSLLSLPSSFFLHYLTHTHTHTHAHTRPSSFYYYNYIVVPRHHGRRRRSRSRQSQRQPQAVGQLPRSTCCYLASPIGSLHGWHHVAVADVPLLARLPRSFGTLNHANTRPHTIRQYIVSGRAVAEKQRSESCTKL